MNQGRIRLGTYSVTDMYSRLERWEAEALIHAAHGLGEELLCSTHGPQGLREAAVATKAGYDLSSRPPRLSHEPGLVPLGPPLLPRAPKAPPGRRPRHTGLEGDKGPYWTLWSPRL